MAIRQSYLPPAHLNWCVDMHILHHIPDLAEAPWRELSFVAGVAAQGQKAGPQPKSAWPAFLA